MTKYIVQDATPQDALGIATVHVKTWQCAYKGQIPDSFLESLSIEKRAAGWKKMLETPEKGNHAFVVKVADRIVGWCDGGVNRDDDATPETGELHGIYVDPEYIGKGVGSALMEHMLATLRKDGYTKATLWVLDTNVKTRIFYEKKGWKVEGKTKEEPRDGVLHDMKVLPKG